jgi:hypothetical protein
MVDDCSQRVSTKKQANVGTYAAILRLRRKSCDPLTAEPDARRVEAIDEP